MSIDGPIGVEIRPGVARVIEDRCFQEEQVRRNDEVRRQSWMESATAS
jgi:hypothetical protein